MSKSCGSCNLCCKLLEIKELEKPVNQWCQFAKPGCGCSIYADKPPSCSIFECLWLRTPEMGDEFKPNKLKAVMDFTPDGKGIVVFCEPNDFETIWKKPELMQFIASMIGDGRYIAINDGTRVNAFHQDSPTRWSLYQGELLEFNEVTRVKTMKFDKRIVSGTISNL